MLDEYRKRRDQLHAWLTADPRLRCRQAGRRVLPVRRHRDALSPDGLRTIADCREALLEEQRVAVTPGEAFDAPGLVRISYATSMETAEGRQLAPARVRREARSTDGHRRLTSGFVSNRNAQDRRRDRRLEQSQQVRQPRRPRVPAAGLYRHSDQSARAGGRRAEELRLGARRAGADRHGVAATCRRTSASRSSTRSRRKGSPKSGSIPAPRATS